LLEEIGTRSKKEFTRDVEEMVLIGVDILELSKVQGARIHDARISALCKQYGVTEFWSADRDFDRFGDLQRVNPLISS
jgi:predicted nucleic acid-binding protein